MCTYIGFVIYIIQRNITLSLHYGKEDEMYFRVMYKQTNNTTKESKYFDYISRK